MKVKVEYTKDYGVAKKGDIQELDSILASKLVYKYKVAKAASKIKNKKKK